MSGVIELLTRRVLKAALYIDYFAWNSQGALLTLEETQQGTARSA